MKRLRNVFTKVSLSLVILLTIASIIGLADAVQAAFTTTSEVKLTPSDAATGDVFGNSVSISGDTAVVGAAYKNTGKGATYVFVRSGTIWNQQAKLTPSDAAVGDYFGISVSVSGNTAVVGAYYKDAKKGAAYVFVRSGTIWNQQAKLTASDGAADDYFGNSVSVSGDTAVVGAYGKNSNKGAAYVFVRSGSIWNQQAKLTASDGAANEYFGDEVSVSSDTAVVGAYGKNSNKGAAYVFVRSGSNWNQQAKLTASDGAASDYFGTSVSISSDTAIVGASGKESHTGAVYVFVRSGSIWSQQIKLTASDPSGSDYFGHAVSISSDTALVGAYCKDSNKGAAYVFVRSGSIWSQQVKLTASDAASGDYFGDSVSVSSDTAVVGAMYKDSAKGAAYVYKNTTRIIPTFTLTLQPPTVSTSAATDIDQSSATLNGNLTSLGSASSVDVSFEYGTTTSYGTTTETIPMHGAVGFSTVITGLNPGTTYHFRAKAVSSYGTATGDDMTFTTLHQPPAIITNPATDITDTSATLNCELVSLGDVSTVKISFNYGTTSSYGHTTTALVVTALGAYNVGITGLNPSTTYHFQAKAESTSGTATGFDTTFTTNALATTTTTTSATTTSTTTTATTTTTSALTTPGVPPSSTGGTGTPATEEAQTNFTLWLYVAIGVLVVVVIIVVIVRSRKPPKPTAQVQKPEPTPPPTPTEGKQQDYFDALKKLAELRDQGVITKEEFESKKNEIMRKIGGSG
jgi:hypothetical protein